MKQCLIQLCLYWVVLLSDYNTQFIVGDSKCINTGLGDKCYKSCILIRGIIIIPFLNECKHSISILITFIQWPSFTVAFFHSGLLSQWPTFTVAFFHSGLLSQGHFFTVAFFRITNYIM